MPENIADVDLDRAKRPFHFLPELNRCVENTDNSSDYESAQAELRLLIAIFSVSTRQSIISVLKLHS
jgi:hypothetical protein